MTSYLSWFHLGLVFVAFAVIHAVAATLVLGRFLKQIEQRHPREWRALGEPRIAGMAPGTGPALFRYLRERGYKALDADVAALARRAWVIGLGATLDAAIAAVLLILFVAGVGMPEPLAGIEVPF